VTSGTKTDRKHTSIRTLSTAR